jgi:WD40 repeat protein/uncharacterized caspase-like protein
MRIRHPLAISLVVVGLLPAQRAKAEADAPSIKLSVQSGEAGIITAIAVSGDGKTLWDLESGREVRRFTGFHGPVWSVSLNPSGTRFVAQIEAADSGVYIFDISQSEPVAAVPHSEDFSAFAWNCRGELSWGDSEGTIYRSDAVTRAVQQLHGHKAAITGIAHSPDCGAFVVGDDDGGIVLWRGARAPTLSVHSGEKDPIRAVAWSPDSRYFAAGSESGRVRLFLSDGSPVTTFLGKADIKGLAFSPDNRYLLSAPEFRKTQVWDLMSKERVAELGSQSEFESSLAVSGDRVYIGSGAVEIWSISEHKQIGDLRGRSRAVTAAAFSADTAMLATGLSDGHAAIWDLTTGAVDVTFPAAKQTAVGAIAFARDSKSLLAIGSDMAQFDIEGRILSGWPSGNDSVVNGGIAESRDGKLVLASQGEIGSLSDSLGSLVIEMGAKDEATNPLALRWQSLTGQIFPGMFSRARLLDEVKQQAKNQNVGGLTFFGDNRAVLWDRADKKSYALDGHAGEVEAAAISANSRLAVTGSKDGTTKLWRLQPCCKELATLISFEDGSWTVVSPDGRFDTSNFEAASGLAWVSDDDPLRALPREAFMKDYYTPRLLPQILAGTLPKLRPPGDLNRVLPRVSITRVEPEANSPTKVSVTVKVEPRLQKGQASGAKDLRLFRDGRMVRFTPGNTPGGEVTFHDVAVPELTPHPVVFSAYVFNSDGVKGLTDLFEYRPPSLRADRTPRAFLVNIGVNKASADNCALRYAASDAREIESAIGPLLRNSGFEVQNGLLVSEAQRRDGAAKSLIESRIREIAAEATPDDLVLISFSGHGYTTAGGEFYLLPSSFTGSCQNPDAAPLAGAISADDLTQWLRPLDAGEIVLIIDACHSAASVEGGGDFRPGPMGSKGLGQLAYDKKIRVLVASQSNQTADETDALGMGFLSYALARDGLLKKQADWKPEDTRIQLREWLSYAVRRVPELYLASARGLITTEAVTRGIQLPDTAGREHRALQTPALFDFSGSDDPGLVLLGPPFPTPEPEEKATSAKGTPSRPPLVTMNAESEIQSLAFSPDGRMLATSGMDQSVYLWDVGSGKRIRELEGHLDSVKSVAFSPDGRQIATAGNGALDNSIRIWDPSTGRQIRRLAGHESGSNAVAFAPNGRILCSGGSDNKVKLRDPETGRVLRTVDQGDIVWEVAFSPDGSLFAGASSEHIRLWKVSTGVLVREIKTGSVLVGGLAFSPDGRTVATAGPNNTAVLYDVGTGAVVRSFMGHTEDVRSVALSPDGKLLATGGLDKTARIWDVASGRELQRFDSHENTVESVAFSPDGKRLASGSWDKTSQIHPIAALDQ